MKANLFSSLLGFRKKKPRAKNWKQGAQRALSRFLWVAIPLLVLLLLLALDALPNHWQDSLVLIFAAILFCAGLPLSAILGLDSLGAEAGNPNQSAVLLFSAFIALFNFLFIGAIVGFFRGLRKKPSSSVNQTGSERHE